MKTRWIFWAVTGLVVIAAGALLMPKSPFYVEKLISSQGYFEGKPTRFWIKAVDSDDPEVRHNAIFALGAIGPDAAVAVPLLAKIMLEDEDRVTRGQASLALSKMTPASEKALDSLTKALEDRDAIVRMNATMAIFRLKEKARSATPAMLKCMKDDSNQTNLGAFVITVQEQMVLTAGCISAGTTEAVPALTELLKTADSDGMRRAAIRALGFVGAEAKPALPEIQPILKSKNNNLREAAEEAVKKIEG